MRLRRLLAATVALLTTAVASAADGRKPNVLVIVADDLGYADVGFQGCKDVPTPNIDSLARGGTCCSNGYVSGPYCSPTRAGLLTGRYQNRFGHEFNPGPNAEKGFGLDLKQTTIADRLKAAGYRTGMVGKWHLGFEEKFNPVNRGFEEYFGFLGGAHPYVAANGSHKGIYRGTKEVEEKEYLTDAFAREAVSYIDRHAKEPFFLYLTFNAVHLPLQASDKYAQRVAGIKDEKRRTYAAMLAAMDDAIGAVLGKLKAAGIEDDTLIAFISDNGGPPVNASSNGPLHGYKATTWEGGIRVPFALQWKGKLPAGKTYDQPVIQLDLQPTILAAAGVAAGPDAKFDGVNLLPYLTGEKTAAPHDLLFWRFGAQIAVRGGDWKLVKANEPGAGAGGRRGGSNTDGAKLFNLKDDIGETADLAAKNPEKVKELASAWDKWNAELVPPSWRPAAQNKN